MIKIKLASLLLAIAIMTTLSIASLPTQVNASHDDDEIKEITLVVKVYDKDELLDIIDNRNDRNDFIDSIADRAQEQDAELVDLVIIYDDGDIRASDRITEFVEDLVNEELEERNTNDRDIYYKEADFDNSKKHLQFFEEFPFDLDLDLDEIFKHRWH